MTESFFDMLFRRRIALVYVGDPQINMLAKERAKDLLEVQSAIMELFL